MKVMWSPSLICCFFLSVWISVFCLSVLSVSSVSSCIFRLSGRLAVHLSICLYLSSVRENVWAHFHKRLRNGRVWYKEQFVNCRVSDHHLDPGIIKNFVSDLDRIPWSQMLSREWRCSCRRCSNYIWVVDNFIAYYGASYIRDSTVILSECSLLLHAQYCTLVHIFIITS